MLKAAHALARVSEIPQAPFSLHHGLASPPESEYLTLMRQLLNQGLYIGFIGMGTYVGAEFGHDAAGALFPVHHQLTRCRVQKDIAQ